MIEHPQQKQKQNPSLRHWTPAKNIAALRPSHLPIYGAGGEGHVVWIGAEAEIPLLGEGEQQPLGHRTVGRL